MNHTVQSKLNWKTVLGGLAAVVAFVGSVVSILQWWHDRPHHKVAGEWTMTTQTLQSDLSAYRGMTLTYSIVIEQDGKSLTGKGEKLGEQLQNQPYREYEPKDRVPVELVGSLNGDAIQAMITEHGKIRETTGNFNWKLQSGSWQGTFESEAANSKGNTFLIPVLNGG